jgi:hypothetical protein
LDADLFFGVAVRGWPDLVLSSLGGGGCRWQAQIWRREELGHGPGRWTTAVGFNPSSRRVSTSTPHQSQSAMGLLQLMVVAVFFFGGSGQRRGGQPQRNLEGSMGIFVLSWFLRVLSIVRLEQLFSYPLGTCLYWYCVYVFLI